MKGSEGLNIEGCLDGKRTRGLAHLSGIVY
jgi:hypothetical protein